MRSSFATLGPLPPSPTPVSVVQLSLSNTLLTASLAATAHFNTTIVADCLKEARFSGVESEPPLQILTPAEKEIWKKTSVNTEDDARSDVKCIGFWTRLRMAYFDIKVVSPFAKSNFSLSPRNSFVNRSNRKFENTVLESAK